MAAHVTTREKPSDEAVTKESTASSKEDRLGLDIIYIRAKKWEDPLSRPEIQKFADALRGKRARNGGFITTSRFCVTAKEFAANIENKIILIDGRQLAQFMIDFGVDVATDAVYELKQLDSGYFSAD
jgi:restriction system protein